MPTPTEIEVIQEAVKVAAIYDGIIRDNHPIAIHVKDGKVIAVTIIAEPLKKLSEAVQGLLRAHGRNKR